MPGNAERPAIHKRAAGYDDHRLSTLPEANQDRFSSIQGSASALVAYCAICRNGRIGREQRLRRWSLNHYAHTGHDPVVTALGGAA
jgi:hypothetical protein